MPATTEKQEKRHGDNVRFLRHRKTAPDNAAIHIELRIENFRHIQRAFGEDIAKEVLDGVHRVLAEALQVDGAVVPAACGTMDVLVWNKGALAGSSLPEACRAWLGDFCELVPLIAVDTTVGPIHLWMTATWSNFASVANDCVADFVGAGSVEFSFLGELPSDEAWAEQYRSDMALVGTVLPAITGAASDDGDALEMNLHWQPVRDANTPISILYHEMLVRLVDRNGASISPAAIFLALERLGFVRPIDHHLISRVIDELEAVPDIVLGANISARSLRCDIWWDEIKARLRLNPGVARRLVVEITETAPIPSISDAVRLVADLRRLGCMIALDDFGTGYASVRQQLALAPDIVKIDQLFLRRAAHYQEHRETLRHLVGLARSLGATVVVEGVETPEQAEVALEVGAVWQQGYHWGAPAASRRWRMASKESGIGSMGDIIPPSGIGEYSESDKQREAVVTDVCHKRQHNVEWDGFDRKPEVPLGVFRGLKYAFLPTALLWWGIIEIARTIPA